MSYIRRSPTSDLYMYESDKGLECSACWLHETERWWATIVLNSTEEAVEHVKEHIAAGHQVPDGLVEDVQNRVELRFIEWAATQRGPDGMSLSADTVTQLIRDEDR